MKGSRLKELREEKGLKQSELAQILNISPSSIGMYETDKRDPDDELKIKISDYFNVSIDYLMGKSDIRELDSNNDIEINDDDIDVAFYEGYKDLEEEDKEVMRQTLKAFLRNKNKKWNFRQIFTNALI